MCSSLLFDDFSYLVLNTLFGVIFRSAEDLRVSRFAGCNDWFYILMSLKIETLWSAFKISNLIAFVI